MGLGGAERAAVIGAGHGAAGGRDDPGDGFRPVNFIAFPGYPRLFAIGTGSDQFANVYRVNPITGFAEKLPPSASPRADAVGQNYGVTSFGGVLRSVDDSARWSGYSTIFNSGSVAAALQYAPGDVNAGRALHLVHLFNDFVIDTDLDTLATMIPGSGNSTDVSTIGPLGADFDDAGAIDAATEHNTDMILAALLPAGLSQSNFYALNQQTGAATLIGPIGNGLLITAMAVEPPQIPIPEPATAILLAASLALSACCLRQRVREDIGKY